MINKESINSVIYFLKGQEKRLPLSLIIAIHGKDCSYLVILNELVRLQLVDVSNENPERYILNLRGRSILNELPKEFDNDPYGYALFEERKRLEEEGRKKWYESENARQQYEDYPTTKKLAIWALIIAALSTLASLAQIFFNHK